jgi:hypothetical protein
MTSKQVAASGIARSPGSLALKILVQIVLSIILAKTAIDDRSVTVET